MLASYYLSQSGKIGKIKSTGALHSTIAIQTQSGRNLCTISSRSIGEHVRARNPSAEVEQVDHCLLLIIKAALEHSNIDRVLKTLVMAKKA
jgi:hypothetical protein